MKHIMTSIRPEWVCKILNREKILEVRKSIPKEVLNGEECLVEMYCTKDQNKILAGTPLVDGSWKCWNRKDWNKQQRKDCGLGKYNGKVVARWYLKYYEEFECSSEDHRKIVFDNKSCLTINQVRDYCNGKTLYGWHIDNLEIYDKPKELSEFYLDRKRERLDCEFCGWQCIKGLDIDEYKILLGNCIRNRLKRPFQSWGYLKDET